MSEEHAVSRRATLKTLGAAGAAFVFAGAVRQDKEQPDVVDLASERFGKGHS